MQPEHVSGAVQYSALCVRSAQSFTAKANAPLMIRSRSPVNRIPSDHALTLNVSSKIRPIYLFLFIVTLLNKCLN